jgi:hypothetical protein
VGDKAGNFGKNKFRGSAIVSAKPYSKSGGVVHFNCPNCNALYRVTKVEARREIIDRWVTCRACSGPLPAREEQFVLKYFLLREAARPDRRARPSSQRALRTKPATD